MLVLNVGDTVYWLQSYRISDGEFMERVEEGRVVSVGPEEVAVGISLGGLRYGLEFVRPARLRKTRQEAAAIRLEG